MSYLVIIAYVTDEDDTDTPADLTKHLKREGVPSETVNFVLPRSNSQEQYAIARDLERFALGGVAEQVRKETT